MVQLVFYATIFHGVNFVFSNDIERDKRKY